MSKANLWAPWRIDYLQQLGSEISPDNAAGAGACFLCDCREADLDNAQQQERLILHRDAHGTLLLNRYPYTNGHLLVAPHIHAPELSDLSAEVRAGLMELCTLGTQLLKQVVNPQGVNIGANLGRAAGAGVPGHLHLHVVPRWTGDTNFMDVVGGVRVIPQALDNSYRILKDAVEGLV